MIVIAVDTFMEVNGDLVWLVDDDEIDNADRVKRSFRPDVYPSEPPSVTEEDRKRMADVLPWTDMDRFFKYPRMSNFESYLIIRRKRRKETYERS